MRREEATHLRLLLFDDRGQLFGLLDHRLLVRRSRISFSLTLLLDLLLLLLLLTQLHHLLNILLNPLPPPLIRLELLNTLNPRLALGAQHIIIDQRVRHTVLAEGSRTAGSEGRVAEEFGTDGAGEVRVGRGEVLDVGGGEVLGQGAVGEP